MLTTQRKAHILKILKATGQIVAKDLSQDLKLSEDTIRRDLRELASEGKLQRVHGGALPSSPAVTDFTGRKRIATEDKIRIGRAAAAMIQPGQVIILDGGTTTLQIAKHLPPELRATVVTHSPTIAVALMEHGGVEIVLIGGRLFKHSMVAVGAAAIDAIARIRADLYFMGVTGIHPETGLTTGDLEEAHIKRALVGSAAETYVLASTEKINAASPFVIAKLEEIDGMIVAKKAAASLQKYRRLGVKIVAAQ